MSRSTPSGAAPAAGGTPEPPTGLAPWHTLLGSIAVGVLGILVADLMTPPGWSVWMLYLIPLLAASWLPGRFMVLGLAALCSCLVAVVYFANALDGPGGVEVLNRVVGILVFWVVGWQVVLRRDAEVSRHLREARYRAAIEGTPDGFWVVDARGRVVEINEAYARLLGYDGAEVLGRHVSEFEAAEDREEVAAHIELVRQAGFHRFETLHRKKDGSTLPVEVTTSYWADPNSFVVFTRDISERRCAEQALRESEERLRLFIEHAPAALAMLDREMRYVCVSQRWLTDYSLEGRDLAGLCHYDVFPDTPERWREADRRALAGEVVRLDAERYERADGGVIYQRREVRPWIRDGQVAGVVIFSEDTTAREKARLAQVESESRRRLILDAVGDAVFGLDERMRITFVNPAAIALFGHAEGEVLGRNMHDLLHRGPGEEHAHPPEMCPVVQCFRADGVGTGEMKLWRKDGSPLAVEFTSSSYRDADGERHVVATFRDVTERRRIEDELRESRLQLQSLIEHAPDAIVLVDADAPRFVLANRNAEVLYGMDRSRLCSLGPVEVSPPTQPDGRTSSEAARAHLDAALEGGETTFEWTHQKPDGTQVPCEVRLVRYPDPTRRLVRGSVTDISERLAAQRALRASAEQLRNLVESVPTGLLVIDLEGCILLANRRIEEWFGYTREELRGQPVEVLIPERFRDAHREHRRHFASAPHSRTMAGRDLFGRRKDGTEFPVEVGLADSVSGDQCVVLAAVSNVSARKQAEADLRQTEARYRMVIDRGLDPLFILDWESRFLDVNHAACDALGYTRQELLGMCVADVDPQITPEGLRRLNESLAAAPGRTVGVLSRHRRKDGVEFPVEVRASAVAMEDGSMRFVAVVRDVSERLRAEGELRESRRFLRGVLDSLTAHIAVLDEAGGILTTNNAWDRFGRDNGGGAGSGRNYFECCFGGEGPRSEEAACVVTGIRWVIDRKCDTFYHEYTCHSPTEQRWFGMRVTPVPGEGPLRVVVAHENITQRKLAEQALARMNQELEERVHERTAELARLAVILDASPDYIGISSFATSKMIYCNKAVQGLPRMLGIETVDRAIETIHPEASGQRILNEGIPTAIQSGSWLGETEVFGPGDAIVPVSQLLLVHRGPDGRPEFLTTIMRDLTEHKKLEAEQSRSEERFRLIAGTIQDVFWITTPKGTRVLYVSPGYEQLWGRTCQSLYDSPRSFVEVIHPDDLATVLPTFEGNDDGPYDQEWRLLRPDGSIRWVRVRGYPVYDAGGEVQFMVGTASDVTEKRLAEMALRERSDELALANVDLAKASRLKDEFLASMSHELRTPLNGVLALSEAMQEGIYGPLTEKQTSVLRDIEQSGRHLLALINDILDLSKVEAGRITLELGPVDVEALCQASQRLVKEVARKKQLRVSLGVDGDLGTILADERRLKQILVNLLSNAVKFTPEGGSVGLEVAGDAERQVVRFTVWDTGIGIRAEDMGLLFRPFQQIDSRLSRQYSGTGLGLALVRRMAELHGGGVSVESEPGKGSRFSATIPWRSHSPEGRLHGDRPRGISVAKVLLVEDSAGDAAQMGRYLREMGIEAAVHPGARGAVERVRAERPDLILLDIVLPDGDGWEVLSAVKADAGSCHVPVVVVSVIDDRTRARGLGATDLLVKPVTREALRAAITRAQAAVGSQGPGAGGRAPSEPALVLLAEDNVVNAEAVRDALRAAGYRVEWATDGAQAVEMAVRLRPRLVVMDIQMPGMDGLEAMRRLRAEPGQEGVPVIAVTALAMPGDRERCLEAGADEYLAKPVSLWQLRQVVERLLAGAAYGPAGREGG